MGWRWELCDEELGELLVQPKGRAFWGVTLDVSPEGDPKARNWEVVQETLLGKWGSERRQGRKLMGTSLSMLLLCAAGTQSAWEFWRQCRNVSPEKPVVCQLPPVISRGWLQGISNPWHSACSPFQLSGPKQATRLRPTGA